MSMRDRIKQALQVFDAEYLEVSDESHLHHRGPESHFKVVIVARLFEGLSSVKRHQRIYAALQNEMKQIHALALHVYTPQEWAVRQAPESPSCRGGGKLG